MDNKKIGELIAKLRKEKGLTQQELGDKVGVGSRAVSKWECGITIPDISIINELSNILGITSNELLSGKINRSKDTAKPKTKINIKLITILVSILIPIILITSILIYFNNKTYTYEISAINHQQFKIEGYITYKNKHLSLHIKDIRINNLELLNTKIIDYEYYVKIKDYTVFGYNQNYQDEFFIKKYTISEIEELLKIDYAGKTHLTKKDILNNNIILEIMLRDEDNNVSNYTVELSLYKLGK